MTLWGPPPCQTIYIVVPKEGGKDSVRMISNRLALANAILCAFLSEDEGDSSCLQGACMPWLGLGASGGQDGA